jgi:hypothetical protein
MAILAFVVAVTGPWRIAEPASRRLGSRVIPGAPEAVRWLRDQGLTVRFCANTDSKPGGSVRRTVMARFPALSRAALSLLSVWYCSSLVAPAVAADLRLPAGQVHRRPRGPSNSSGWMS